MAAGGRRSARYAPLSDSSAAAQHTNEIPPHLLEEGGADGSSNARGSSRGLLLLHPADVEEFPLGNGRRQQTIRKRCLCTTLAILLCALVVASGIGLLIYRFVVPWAVSLHPQPAVGNTAAVATEHPICSQIGIDLLKKGGNAVDSAIGMGLCIGTVNSFSSGIGGGGFMLIRLPRGSAEFLDFREQAPAGANKTMYAKNPKASQDGGLAVAIPGEVRGFWEAHRKHGNLSWSELFQPSIHLARDGFPMTPVIRGKIENVGEDFFLKDPAFREIFAPEGKILDVGETIRRENYARTLEALARDWRSFYTGPIAERIVETVQQTGGIITMRDMANYTLMHRTPRVGFYHGFKVITGEAPSGGPILLSMLNIVERYNFGRQANTPLNTHRMVEAFKFGYAQRTELGDLDFLNDTVRTHVDQFVSKEYAVQVRRNISDSRTFPLEHYNPEYDVQDTPGTTHISVVDGSNMAVSLTSTVNMYFGSKVMDRTTGIILNNEMDDFSSPNITNAFGLRPSPNNYIQPWKRPLSSSSPAIVERDGQVHLVVGASGGSLITTSVLQTIVNVLDWQMNIQQAISAPRIHHQLLPNTVSVEREYPSSLVEGLKKRGHEVEMVNKLAVVQGVMRLPNGQVHAGADGRKGGQGLAY